MQQKVELHVAFYANWREPEFSVGKTTYHVISPGSIRRSTIRNIIRPYVIHLEDTQVYLQIIDRVKPDLIHIHGTENAFGTILDSVDVSVICSLQGILSPYSYRTGGDAHHELHAKPGRINYGLKSLLFEKGLMHQYRIMQLMAQRETRYIRNIKFFMGRTDWDRRVSSVMSPGSRYFKGDEIMRDIFYQKEWKPVIHNGKWIVHTTLSDHPMKGFRTIADAILILENAGLSVEWRIAGISEGSSVVRVYRKELGKKYPAGSIKLLGRITADTLADKMMEAHVFVLPSYMENSPNSLCEAMLMGMPCIATNSGGIPSLIEDAKDGILVQTRDPWALSGALMEIFNDIPSSIEKGRSARRRALYRHDPQRIVDQVVSAYRSINGI